MSEKRKDSKGRVLRTGESQRKDGLYQYRYKDINGERRTIYERDLHELRNKEKEIEIQLTKGVSHFDGSIKLETLIDQAFALKRNWRDSTRYTMTRYLNIVKNHKIYQMQINKIKMVDCKQFFIELSNQGYSFKSLSIIHSLLRMAFDIACESDAIYKNPCSFKLRSVIDDNTEKIVALTPQQEESLLSFLSKDSYGRRHYDMFVILLGTGLRISEFAALTIKDIDFENNQIHVDKQISRLVGSVRITQPKSTSAKRTVPMTKEVRASVLSLMAKRRQIKTDVMIDGHVGFLSVTRTGRPRTHSEYADAVNLLMKRYNESEKIRIEKCTPHVLRHTFCTKCISCGMDVKTVQYLMGHSSASTTLDVYADAVVENLSEHMLKLSAVGG